MKIIIKEFCLYYRYSSIQIQRHMKDSFNKCIGHFFLYHVQMCGEKYLIFFSIQNFNLI